MRKSWLALFSVLLLAAILVACGGGDDKGSDTGSTSTPSEQADDGATGGGEATEGVDVDAAEAKYRQACMGCHGGNLEGASGPPLDKVGADLSEADILDAIENGRPGMSGGILKGDDAKNVAAWLAGKK